MDVGVLMVNDNVVEPGMSLCLNIASLSGLVTANFRGGGGWVSVYVGGSMSTGGSLSRGWGFCPGGVSVQGGLCQGDLPTVEWAVRILLECILV